MDVLQIYCCVMCAFFFFFFKQKTAYEMRISDWSSDVCSSDLPQVTARSRRGHGTGADDGARTARDLGGHGAGQLRHTGPNGPQAPVTASVPRSRDRKSVV